MRDLEDEPKAETRPGRGRVSGLASDTFLSRIVRGVWKPGERIPSERQLSEELSMSRASVREAIRGLEAMGLLDVRHGQGVFVRAAHDPGSDTFFAGWQVDHRYSIGELLAFRLLIEPELAALAAKHADLAFVEELTMIMVAMERAARDGDLPGLVRMDTAFHDAITRHAANRLYRDLLEMVGQFLIDSRRISLGVPGRAVQVVAAHNRIVDAVRAGDADAAAAAMRLHLEKFSADMRVQPVGHSRARGA